MTKTLIGLISGSSRKASINTKLAKAIGQKFVSKGADTIFLDLNNYPMPIYNGDYEDKFGVPETAKKLVQEMLKCDGIFIATPEYNGSLPPLLKNTIDWTSRLGLEHFQKPVFAIGAATQGALSGIMVLRELHFILCRLGANVVPTQLGVGNFSQIIDDKGGAKPSFIKKGRIKDLADKMTLQILEKIND